MEINLHKLATTTPATRSYIQASTKTAVALSAELGVSMTTIYKWKHAGRTQDGSHTRHNPGAGTPPQHEAIIRELRVNLCLSLNDIMESRRYCGIRIASVGRLRHPRRFGFGELNFVSVSINL